MDKFLTVEDPFYDDDGVLVDEDTGFEHEELDEFVYEHDDGA